MDLLAPSHLIIILIVALVVFGPKKLPELGRGLGRGMRDFKDAMSGDDDAIRRREAADEAAQHAATIGGAAAAVTAASAVATEPIIAPPAAVAVDITSPAVASPQSVSDSLGVAQEVTGAQSAADFYAGADEPLLSPPSAPPVEEEPEDEPVLLSEHLGHLAPEVAAPAPAPAPEAPERPSAPATNA
jgi:sec-independent protein translocase protein TatA